MDARVETPGTRLDRQAAGLELLGQRVETLACRAFAGGTGDENRPVALRQFGDEGEYLGNA